MRYTRKTPFSQPTRDHHGTHQGDTAEYPPTVRPGHPLPAGNLPRAHPTPEQTAPPPPWKRYTQATHRHSPPAGTAPGPQHAQEAATHQPADPANAIPPTTGPTQRWADTPKHHTTTPPGCDTSVPHTPPQGTPGPTPHQPPTANVLKHARRTIKRPRGAAPHRQRTNHGRQPTPTDLDTVPPPRTGRPPHSTTRPYRTAPPSPTRGHGTPQPTNTGTKPRPADSAPHPTGTTPGIPAHLAPAQHPPPATT